MQRVYAIYRIIRFMIIYFVHILHGNFTVMLKLQTVYRTKSSIRERKIYLLSFHELTEKMCHLVPLQSSPLQWLPSSAK